MPQQVRVGIIDGRTLARESLGQLLAAEQDFEIVGDWPSVDDALRAANLTAADMTTPDIVLLTCEIGSRSGTSLARTRELAARTKVIVLAERPLETEDEVGLIRAGVAGILDARTSSDAVRRSIRDVHAGLELFDAGYLRSVVIKLGERHSAPLNDRQMQVLALVFEGLTNREIAARLRMSLGSVKAVLQQLFARAGVRRRSQLIRKAPEIFKEHLYPVPWRRVSGDVFNAS